VQFNRPADTSTLNLYNGGSYGSSDVTLIGPGGAVTGSLVWNSTTNTATFIKTGGVLAPGNYTATLVSGSSAWKDSSGNTLQSNDPSGNYVAHFTVVAPGDTLSMADIVRGPGQDVNLPATATSGVPITLSSGSGVTAVDFHLTYDPSLLVINAVNPGSSFPASGWAMTTNLGQPGFVPGDLHVSISGTSSLPAGLINLLNLSASVPTTARYGGSAALKITSLRINEDAIASTADVAVQKVAFIGDVSGNRGYSGLDASMIRGVVVGNATGFDAYPLVDPVLVGDVSADGSLSGQDASYVAQASVNIPVSQIPALPASNTVLVGPIVGEDPLISAGTNILVNPSGTANLPISISDGTGVFSENITVTFDASKFTLTGVSLGSIDAAGWTAVYNPSSPAGTAVFTVFSNNGTALPNGSSGVFANVQFAVANTASNGVSTMTVQPSPTSYLNEGNPPITVSNGSFDVERPTVGNAYLFYFGSAKFDAGSTTPNVTTDFGAVATDKSALLPNGVASFNNVSSYSLGLNGLLIDFPNMLPGTQLTAADFSFSTGTSGSTWTTLTAAQLLNKLTIVMGTDPTTHQVAADVTFTNNFIQNTWLRVTVLHNSNTKLAADTVFYYGNLIGSTGVSISGGKLRTQQADVTAIQNKVLPTNVAITNLYDIDRSGKVQQPDVTAAQNNVLPTGLTLFTAPPPPSAPEVTSAVVTPLSLVTSLGAPSVNTSASGVVTSGSTLVSTVASTNLTTTVKPAASTPFATKPAKKPAPKVTHHVVTVPVKSLPKAKVDTTKLSKVISIFGDKKI